MIMRHLAVTYAPAFQRLYRAFLGVLLILDPLWRVLGPRRTQRLLLAVEKPTKSLIFDCRMCGACILGQTGMSCPMNCPKNIRNGPCGGVRANGHCEVRPDMRCVWVEAWRGCRTMRNETAIMTVQPALDHRLKGRSSWVADLERRRAERSAS